MKFIYVPNYLNTTREDKKEFLILLNSFRNFKIRNQKILLSDDSLLLELDDNSQINFTKEVIDKFFDENEDIRAQVLQNILHETDEVTLIFEDGTEKRIKL